MKTLHTEDKISIKELVIHANHGVFPEEKKLGQRFILNLNLYTSIRQAGRSDDLSKTIHYGEVAHDVQSFFTENTYDLIETCVEQLAQFLLLKYPLIHKLDLEVQKPWAPIGLPLTHASVSVSRRWHTAYIAFGSNLGDKNENIEKAVEAVDAQSQIRVVKRSTIYETEPVGYADQDNFLNGVMKVETLLSPHELLTKLQQIELDLKRVRTIVNGPRTIDLDIILYDDLIMADSRLVIPHPRMHQRLFVLEPLFEIAPYEVHPLYRKRIADLVDALR